MCQLKRLLKLKVVNFLNYNYMKKTCGALIISLMITTNVYAKEKSFDHPCKKIINQAIMYRTFEQKSSWAFAQEDFSWMVANQKRCAMIADLILAGLAGYNLASTKTPQPTNPTVNNCGQVESELRECKQQLSNGTHEAGCRGFIEGQTMPNPYRN